MDGHAQPLGPVLTDMLKRLAGSQAGLRGRLERVVQDSLPAEFHQHCQLGPLRTGVLTVLVGCPSCLYMLRMQWHRRLLEQLQRQVPEAGIRDILFRLEHARRA